MEFKSRLSNTKIGGKKIRGSKKWNRKYYKFLQFLRRGH